MNEDNLRYLVIIDDPDEVMSEEQLKEKRKWVSKVFPSTFHRDVSFVNIKIKDHEKIS